MRASPCSPSDRRISRVVLSLFLGAVAAPSLLGCRRAMRDDAPPPVTEVGAPAAGSGSASAEGRGMKDVVLASGGRERHYLLFVPEHVTAPASLVVSLHGGGGTAEGVERQTGWARLASEKGFVVAYPQGVGKSWNDGREDTPSESVKEHVDDVAFLAAVVADATQRAAIDPAHVYVNGISNGGFMSARFACERADLVRAVGIVAATIGPDVLATCKPSRPVAVIAFNGTSDPLVPFGGGAVHIGPFVRGKAASVDDAIAMWARADGCAKDPARSEIADHDPDDGSTVHLDVYSGCTASAAVHRYTVEGGGHTWPGGRQYLPPRIVGRVNRDVDATARMWDFFVAH